MPRPEFLSDVTLYSKPANALLVHFIAASVFIIAAPLDGTDRFLLLGAIAAFSEAVVGGKMARWVDFIPKIKKADSVTGYRRTGILGVALLFARWIKTFKKEEEEWQPQSFRKWGNWLIPLLASIFVTTNTFIVVLYWLPFIWRETEAIGDAVTYNFWGATISMTLYSAGAVYWMWDQVILRSLGYNLTRREAMRRDGRGRKDVYVFFVVSYYSRLSATSSIKFVLTRCQRTYEGRSKSIIEWWLSTRRWIRAQWNRVCYPQNERDDG